MDDKQVDPMTKITDAMDDRPDLTCADVLGIVPADEIVVALETCATVPVARMSIRTYAAIQIMAGFAVETTKNKGAYSAQEAVKWADALLAELEKEQRS